MLIDLQGIEDRQKRTIVAAKAKDIWSIFYAAEHGKLDRIRTLLKRESTDKHQIHPKTFWSALHYAAKYMQKEILVELIEHELDVHLQDQFGNTALHLSATSGSVDCCRVLLLAGAENDVVNMAGHTPVEAAKLVDAKEVEIFLRAWTPLGPSHREQMARKVRVAEYKTSETLANQKEKNPIYLELQSLALKERIHGKQHQGNLTTLLKLSSLYQEDGQFEKAVEYHEHSMELCKHVHGADSVELGILQCNAGMMQFKLNHFELSEQLYLTAHQKLKALDANEELMLCEQNLASLYWHQQNHDKAQYYFTNVLSYQEQKLGNKHPQLISILNGLSVQCIQQQLWTQAEQFSLQSLDIAHHVYETFDLRKTEILDHLGYIYLKLDQLQKSLEHFSSTQKILLQHFDIWHPQISQSQNNLSFVQLFISQRSSANVDACNPLPVHSQINV